MIKASPKKKTIAVDSIKHKDDRANIPTQELRGFVKDEDHPKSLLYSRDTSLDPQLVWRGKDEQDRSDLEVPVVPIYIQEKIHPQAIIDSLKQASKTDEIQSELNLFADFNGIGDDFSKRIDFYSHDVHAHWSNRMILGDSLLVMTSLAEKEGLRGKVQCIYLDPPYGIKFGSNWQVSTRKNKVDDGKAAEMSREPEQVKAFRDTWTLGIHSYLAYLRDRLVVARDLLTETGSVFVQIGDENVHLVRNILDEVFGSENFISQVAVTKTTGLGSTKSLPSRFDYLLWYSKAHNFLKIRSIFEQQDDPIVSGYSLTEVTDEKTHYYMSGDLTKPGPGQKYEINLEGNKYNPGKRWWGYPPESITKMYWAKRLLLNKDTLRFKRYFEDFSYKAVTNLWDGIGGAADPIYVVQTNTEILKRCILMTTDPGDLVLDPTCGSGTTAYVAEQWGRR